MHITDIVQNSVRAKAKLVELNISEVSEQLKFTFIDDGCGMDEETQKKVSDPFYTSRTTRKVGLGIPLFMQSAEQTGGELKISSEVGKGTIVKVSMGLNHIDRPPIGDLPSTIAMLITGNPDIELVFTYCKDEEQFVLDSREVKEVLGEVDIRLPQVTSFLKEMIKENLKELNTTI